MCGHCGCSSKEKAIVLNLQTGEQTVIGSDAHHHSKVVVLSVTEGEDKPLKYPLMFQAARVMLLSKCDLQPYVDFDQGKAIANARQVNPDIIVLKVSSRSGEGVAKWYGWLRTEVAAARAASAIF